VPRWDPELLAWVRARVEDDTHAFLKHAGQWSEFWDLGDVGIQ
jgi:hypothetical protein